VIEGLDFSEEMLAVWEMHYLVGTPEGIGHFVELHELALFSPDEYRAAFQAAGLEASHVPEDLCQRTRACARGL
jgi:hypothetical protein